MSVLIARPGAALLPGLLLAQALAFACPLRSAETQDVAFTAKWDGSEQRYALVLPDGFTDDAAHGVLIALHGHGADRWQFVKDGRDECRAARDAAAENGMLFVSPDYRAKTSWMGPAAEADLVQILKELRSKYRIDRVVVSGGSMGGTSALTFAALHPELVDGVVAMNGTANLVEYEQFQEAIAASYGGTKREKPDEYRKRSAELHADRLTMPVAFTTGARTAWFQPTAYCGLRRRSKRKVGGFGSSIDPKGATVRTMPMPKRRMRTSWSSL